MLNLIRYACVLIAAVVLSGCIGDSDANKAQVRLLNLSQDYSSLDMYADDDRHISDVATGTTSGYAKISEDTYTIGFASHDASTKLKTFSQELKEKTHRTYVGFGRKGSFNTLEIGEDQDEPDSGDHKLVILNATSDAGALDVYLTGASEDLADASPVASNVEAGTTYNSGHFEIDSGTYRVRVTGTGDTSDVRLDVSSVTFGSEGVSALVLGDTVGGVLVNAVHVPQEGTMNFLNNTMARLRAVNGVSSGNATVNANSTEIMNAQRPNTVGNYTLVEAGSIGLSVTIGSSTLSVPNETLTAGRDYTYLLWSSGSTNQTPTLITDDNRLPTSSKYKVRLVNAMSALADELYMSVDGQNVASALAVGQASSYSEFTATSTESEVYVDSSTIDSLYSSTSTTFAAKGVYSLFMFGDASSATSRLRKER